jgi:hypothetical protein
MIFCPRDFLVGLLERTRHTTGRFTENFKAPLYSGLNHIVLEIPIERQSSVYFWMRRAASTMSHKWAASRASGSKDHLPCTKDLMAPERVSQP